MTAIRNAGTSSWSREPGSREWPRGGLGPGPVLGFSLVLLLVAACKGRDPDADRLLGALRACDYGATCASALAQARSLAPDVAAGADGVEVRRLALRVGLQAAAAFPPLDPAAFPPPSAADLAGEAEALGDPDAVVVASLLARPSCKAFQDALAVHESGGPLAQAALMAGMHALAQVLAAITPDRVSEFARAARDLIGCTVSERASPAAVLVQVRQLLHDLARQCQRSPPSEAVAQSSCKAVQDLLAHRTLPLPWPDAGGGDLLYTMPPASLRSTGLHQTPPFALVLAAGRLGVFDQPVLAPGVLASPETRVDWVLDLRGRHLPDDVVLALQGVLETRKPIALEEVQAVFFVVDRATPASEFFEVLLALTAASDAVAAIAMTLPGRPDPVFLPVNYWIEGRVLMDPLGRGRAFGRDPPLVVRLAPFRAEVARRDRAEVVEFPAGNPVDLRPLYRAALSLIGDESAVSARVIADGPVPVGLLASVLEVLSFRVPDPALESPGAFGSAVPLRGRDARPLPLCSVFVVAPPD